MLAAAVVWSGGSGEKVHGGDGGLMLTGWRGWVGRVKDGGQGGWPPLTAVVVAVVVDAVKERRQCPKVLA